MRKIPIAEGKVRVLRKVKKNGKSNYGRFQHPTKIGELVEALDWNTKHKCGGGIHGLLEAEGDWYLLYGDLWQVYEVAKEDIVKIDKGKIKFRRGTLVYIGGDECLLDYFDLDNMSSQAAFYWALFIGDREIMRNRVTESRWAYSWAFHMGDLNIMREKVTEPEWDDTWKDWFHE